MRRLTIVGLVVILSLLLVPAALAQHDIKISGDYWIWDGSWGNDSIAGNSYVLEVECIIRPKLNLRYMGIFSSVDSINNNPIIPPNNFQPSTHYLTLHYWFHENFNVNAGFIDKNITFSNSLIDVDILEFKGLRFGIGAEMEILENWKLFGDLGYAPNADIYFLGGIQMPKDAAIADFRAGMVYEFTEDVNFRAGYMAHTIDMENMDMAVDGIFVGISFNF